jgi:di/tricarboxylate transporter
MATPMPPPAQRSGAVANDTKTLLRSGGSILAVGIFSAALAITVFGGLGPQGPHTNGGWLSLMLAMGCLPFGTLLLALGLAKWIGHRRG